MIATGGRSLSVRTKVTSPAEDQLVSGGDRRPVDDRHRRQILVGADEGDVAAGLLDVFRRRGGR
jgi:hypothetical protein